MQKPFICWRWYFVKNKFLQNSEKVLFPMWAILCCAFSDFHFIAVYLIIFFLFCYLLFVCFFPFSRSIDQSHNMRHPSQMIWECFDFGLYVTLATWTQCNLHLPDEAFMECDKCALNGPEKLDLSSNYFSTKIRFFFSVFNVFAKMVRWSCKKMREMNVCGGKYA